MKQVMTMVAASALLMGCDGDNSNGTKGDLADPVKGMAFADVSIKDIKSAAGEIVPSGLEGQLSKDEMIEFLELNNDISDYEVTGENGDFVVTNMVMEEATVGRLTFDGVVYVEDQDIFYFDSVLMEDMTSNDSDFEASIERVFMNPPAYVDARKMIDSIDIDALVTETLALDASPFISSGHGYIEGAVFGDDQGELTLDFMGWTEDTENRHTSMLVKGFNLEFYAPDFETPVTLELGSFSVKNMHWEVIESAFTGNPFYYNPFWPYFDGARFQGLEFKADGFYIKNNDYGIWYTPPENGVAYYYATPDPLRVGFDSEPSSEEMQTFKEYFDRLGYDEIRIRNEGRVVYDYENDLVYSENARLVIEDGMDIDAEMKISGSLESFDRFKTMFQNMEDVGESYEDTDPAVIASLKDDLTAALKPLDIETYAVSMTENSLMDRIFRVVAEEQGDDVESIKEQAAGASALLTMVAQTPYQSELALDFANSMGDFIERGGTFKIGMGQDKSIDIIEEVFTMVQDDSPDVLEGIDLVLKYLELDFDYIPPAGQAEE